MCDGSMHSISSREFNQDVSKAKRAAEKGTVFITDWQDAGSCAVDKRGLS